MKTSLLPEKIAFDGSTYNLRQFEDLNLNYEQRDGKEILIQGKEGPLFCAYYSPPEDELGEDAIMEAHGSDLSAVYKHLFDELHAKGIL